MIVYPNCKINLGLHIVAKRPDGFHDLETVFYPVNLSDALEILPCPDAKTNTIGFSGIEIDGHSEENLCMKALNLMQEKYGIEKAQMHLHKAIPMGAGLGGGSADAAFTLSLVNDLFNIGLLKPELEALASELGSDCAFFIRNQPVLATGRGNDFQDIKLSLRGLYLLLVYPHVHVSTKEAYAGVRPAKPAFDLRELESLALPEWQKHLKNDFEHSVFKAKPILGQIKEQIIHLGAVYAAMSGSGSSIFGLFEEKPVVPDAFKDYFVHLEEMQ